MYFVIPVVSRKSGSSSAVSSCIASITQIAASTPMSTHSQVGAALRKCIIESILQFDYVTSSPRLGRQIAFDIIGCSRSKDSWRFSETNIHFIVYKVFSFTSWLSFQSYFISELYSEFISYV